MKISFKNVWWCHSKLGKMSPRWNGLSSDPLHCVFSTDLVKSKGACSLLSVYNSNENCHAVDTLMDETFFLVITCFTGWENNSREELGIIYRWQRECLDQPCEAWRNVWNTTRYMSRETCKQYTAPACRTWHVHVSHNIQRLHRACRGFARHAEVTHRTQCTDVSRNMQRLHATRDGTSRSRVRTARIRLKQLALS